MIEPRIIFFGTSDFAVTVLSELSIRGIVPILIVTETDKPKGRGNIVTPPPAKRWGLENNIPLFQPTVFDKVTGYKLQVTSSDLFLVAEYGKILPKSVLELPKHGVLNIHPSLLPKYRGPSPIQSAILSNDRRMGVTIILLDEKMDHGPILSQKEVSFDQWPPTADDAQKKLAREGTALLVDALPGWIDGTLKPVAQNDDTATFTKKLVKEDGVVELNAPAYKNWRKFCALGKSPGVYLKQKTGNGEINVKITAAEFDGENFNIRRVIPPSKREMNYEDFLRGL